MAYSERNWLVERGRVQCEERDWLQAYDSLVRADALAPLQSDDLERFALAANMTGRRDEFRSSFERAFESHLAAGDARAAVRCAFWLGLDAGTRGETSAASAWLARASRHLTGQPDDCVERGYLLLPQIDQQLSAGNSANALEMAERVLELAERHEDHGLLSFALHAQGVILLRRGELERGLARLDEAMLSVTEATVFPMLAGIVYCSAISACRKVLDLHRMKQWTDALTRWCDRQSGIVPFLGECKVYRSELFQLGGDWPAAMSEAEEAVRVRGHESSPRALAMAWYQLGELHRLRGELEDAEAAYRQTLRLGRDPQPGLAELWLRQGRPEAASKALERALDEVRDEQVRFRLLPAYIHALLQSRALDLARKACEELTDIAQRISVAGGASTPSLAEATALECTGEVSLALGEPGHALAALRRSQALYGELGAPFESARVRTAIGLACREIGDFDSAALELEAARETFERLAARSELEQVLKLLRAPAAAERSPLSPRETQVLTLVARGLTNREIAADLEVSVRTVDRHVSNVFDKLGVRNRAGATSFALEHGLLPRN